MYKINLFFALVVNLLTISVFAQNIAITDDDTYNAESSAMLDVKSLSKGILIPRLTSLQRTSILTPATGLLVFDTNLNSFYYWNGTSWTNLTSGNASGIWGYNTPNVYLNNATDKLGIGTTTPFGKMEVKSDVSLGTNDPIFQVVNNNGDTVFAVYQQGVRVNVEDGVGKATGSKGGFAVGGFSPSKGTITNEFLRVTPDSVRIYIEDDPVKAAGSKGGFAVGGFSPSKTTLSNYMDLTPENYFIGHESGLNNTTGLYNSFFGYQTGKANTTGSNNVFAGYQTGLNNTEGSSNVFMGNSAGLANTTGYENIFIGNNTGISNLNGKFNVFIGPYSGYSNLGGTGDEGSYNVFLGDDCGHYNTTGYENVFIGYRSGYNNLTGTDNVFLGFESGRDNTTGSRNVFLGMTAGHRNLNGFANTFIGDGSGYYNQSGGNNTFLGYVTGYNNISGAHNVFLGSSAGYMNSDGNYNVFMGYESGFKNTSGNDNLFLGYQSGHENTLGSYNTFLGYQCGYANTTGNSNLFLGYQSGFANTTGTNNMFFGDIAGKANTAGNNNMFIGPGSGQRNTLGSDNIYLGFAAGVYNTTGGSNIFIGKYSGYNNNDGYYNLFIGTSSGASNTSGATNIFLGEQSGWKSETGNNNVYLGYQSGHENVSGSGNLFLGYTAGYNELGSGKLYIDNSNTSTPLIYGDFSTNNVIVNGTFKTTGILYDKDGDAGTNGQVLSTTGSGADWISLPSGLLSGSGTVNQVAFFTDASTLSSNSKLYWNNTTAKLGINVSPTYNLHVVDDVIDNDDPAIYGIHAVSNNYGVGVYGKGGFIGVKAQSNTSTSGSNYGVYTTSTGTSTGINYGIYSRAIGGATNWAGWFEGDVYVNGTLSKSAGTFKIDHPLDPENKYLIHSFVESPDMMNIYNGVITLDNDGNATVTLPNYFNTLNKDYRYQLTPVGASMPNLYISEEISENTFKISGGQAGKKVSWEVTGIRQDPYAVKHPIIVEKEKADADKGLYLNPELYNLPKSKAIYNEKK
ncbi:MAG: hypothetical protein A2046_14820 [Bacteroidetes bacterium GWA2_30_7]|nr:MAG: hypothetical protein A2046_14820 [Bacteroidetes bacterium GWA2_30_7]